MVSLLTAAGNEPGSSRSVRVMGLRMSEFGILGDGLCRLTCASASSDGAGGV